MCNHDATPSNGHTSIYAHVTKLQANPYHLCACSVLPCLQVPGLAVASNVNVSVHLEASMRGGEPLVERESYTPTASGDAHHFQLYAMVDSISPALGSVAGGYSVHDSLQVAEHAHV